MDDDFNPPPSEEPLTIDRAIANLQGNDLGLRMYAAWWLGKFRVREPLAISRLIQALQDDDDRTEDGGYPLRRNAARALGKLGDRESIAPLIDCLSCSDFYVREAAAQSLEMLGDPICIPDLVQLLNAGLQDGHLIAAQPDFAQPYDAVLEALGTLGATDSICLIQPFLTHPIERVQYAAARAMYQLTQDAQYGDRLITALAGDDLQLRRSALADLGAIGYLPAAEAIAETLAENSLKLIALKGLLEYQINQSSFSELSEGAVHVMALMDSLL